MNNPDLEQLVLEFVQRPNYQPLKPKAIAKKLGLSKEDTQHLKVVVKKLVKKGQLAWGSRHFVTKVGGEKSRQDRVTGRFKRTSGGFGFVRPEANLGSSDRSGDIYIPIGATQDAADGDLVLVRIRTRKGSGAEQRVAGEIVEVIERETHQFVGTYIETHAVGLVRIDGGVFANPVPVGDPGAKGVNDGDKVVIEMVRFPSHQHDGEGVIVEVLGAKGAPGVDTLSIMREFNLPGDFPEEVLEDSREQAEKFTESLEGRTDLTELTIITIDPITARDFDDAISLEKLENGHWRLGVHIADVSHFVRPGSPLDREARDRATSIYLPDRVIPMIPEIISNNLASLQPDRVRYTKTVFIEFTADGARVAVEPASSAIKSKRRFTYEEIDEYLADRHAWKKKLTPEVFDLVGQMHELAMILRKRRFERGAIELSMRDVEIDLDKQGKVSGAHLAVNTESHQMIEEFMLSANEAVAEMFDDRELFFLRRIHASPDPRKLRDLTEFVSELGIEVENLQDRFEIQRVLEEVKGKPFERAANYAVLRSMQKAVYGPQEEGHYALASHHYCHFTSPIRRYPDLTVHRQLDAIIQGRTPHGDYEQLVVLGTHCSEREQRAEAAERELIKVKLLNYLASRLGEKMKAVVTGVQDFGLFAQGLDIPAEGLIHISSMHDDYYQFEPRTHTLAGSREGNSYRLGDVIEVEVVHVDVDRRELDLRLVSVIAPSPAGAKFPPSSQRTGGPIKGRTTKSKPRFGAPKPARGGGRPPKKKGGKRGKRK